MIKMKLYGGIGNQLFQWAYAKSMSLDNDMDYVFDDSHYELCYKHFYALDRIPAIQKECVLSRDKKADAVFHDPSQYIPLGNLPKDKSFYFDGYWQCERYFKHHEDIIRNCLKPRGEIKERLLSRYNLNNSVALHVRRSDYLDSNGFHPVMGTNYYEKAMKEIGHADNILIFSDDIPWCKNTLKFDNMVFVEGNNNIEDLWLMSMCDHNIIANSSYSWWGSWINENPNKKVVAPSNWFGNSANNQQIYLKDWIVI